MTIPFWCVFIAFGLNLVTKMPVAVAMQQQSGGYDNRHPRDQQRELEGWGRRALAAHLNSFEAFPAFAAAVIVASLSGADPEWSSRLAVLFIVARIVYSACYLANLHLLRSAVWTVGFAATTGLFVLAAAA